MLEEESEQGDDLMWQFDGETLEEAVATGQIGSELAFLDEEIGTYFDNQESVAPFVSQDVDVCHPQW